MILASIQSDLSLVLALIGGCFGLVLYLIGLTGYLTARQVTKAASRPGSRKAFAEKAGNAVLSAGIKRLFFGRWF